MLKVIYVFEVLNLDQQETERTLLRAFDNREGAKKKLIDLCEKYTLCQKLCGLYNSQGACFHYEVRQCNGACIGAEHADIIIFVQIWRRIPYIILSKV